MERKAILIVLRDFPYNSPMALRMRSFVKLFDQLGHRVSVLCFSFNGTQETVAELNGGHVYPLQKTGEGFKKISLFRDFSSMLTKAVDTEKPDCIFTCSLYHVIPMVLAIAGKRSIPVLLESCEWFDPSTFKHGKLDLHFIMHSVCWRWYYPKATGVVAISRLLYDHYRVFHDNVIRVPTIVDTANTEYRIKSEKKDRIDLLFAGSLARTKDSVKEFFEALELIEQREKFRFVMIGVEAGELRDHIGPDLYNEFRDQSVVLGRVHQQLIDQKYRECDFGIFFRPKRRSSDAGFSTKLGEGMTAATPFIVNSTGDIPLYLEDGVNAFLAESVSDIAGVYRRILALSTEEMEKMRVNARGTAERYFDYRRYAGPMEELLEKMNAGGG